MLSGEARRRGTVANTGETGEMIRGGGQRPQEEVKLGRQSTIVMRLREVPLEGRAVVERPSRAASVRRLLPVNCHQAREQRRPRREGSGLCSLVVRRASVRRNRALHRCSLLPVVECEDVHVAVVSRAHLPAVWCVVPAQSPRACLPLSPRPGPRPAARVCREEIGKVKNRMKKEIRNYIRKGRIVCD